MCVVRLPLALIAITLSCTSIGCASLQPDFLKSPFDALSSGGEKTTPITAESANIPTCTVEFRSESKESGQIQIPVNESSYVQGVISAAGATKRFRRIHLKLARQLPQGGWHHMDVSFDNATDKVKSNNDYAVHPGDRLIVTEDTSTSLDRLFQSMAGNVSRVAGR